MNLKKIRGTQDIYGKNMILFNYIVNVARKTSKLFNFIELYLPIIENSDLFNKTLGDTSDIVHKETYSFLDRSKSRITLRPEFTTVILRAILSNEMLKLLPLRIFTQGQVFRHERPQNSRLRQFNQINFEYIGYNNIKAEVELIYLAYYLLNELKIYDKLLLKLNTIGDDLCKYKYNLALQNYFLNHEKSFSFLDKIRLLINPIRLLDSKNLEKNIIFSSPELFNFIHNQEKRIFEKLLLLLKELKIKFQYDKNLVRGIDYYSGTVFEVVYNDGINNNAIFAGGRYDRLIYNIGGYKIKGIGFAIGIERIMEFFSFIKIKRSSRLYLIPVGKIAEQKSFIILNYFRKNNVSIFIDYGISFKKRICRANKYFVDYLLLYGNKELKENILILKNMKSGVHSFLNIFHIKEFLKSI